jgi:hypothetical protein
MIESAKEIIKQIKSIIPLSLQKTSSITKTRSKTPTGSKKKRKTSKKYNKKIITQNNLD